jgi:hypothetical protein
MLDDLAELLKVREERIKLGKVKLIVRELDGSADNSILKEEEDRTWRIFVRCVYREDSGERAFGDEDIPALKRKSPVITAPLINAVNRVNGFDLQEEAKNSDAVPA